MYACDHRWWDAYGQDCIKTTNAERWIQNNEAQRDNDKEHYRAAKKWGCNIVYGRFCSGLGKEFIHYGENSGYQAINLAYLWGAAKIILLGFDMQATGGKVHFFGDHKQGLCNGPAFENIAPKFTPLAKDLKKEGVEVINCTRKTALTCFKRQDLKTVLQSL